MDVDRQTNLPEEQMSQRRSLSSNYRHYSQSRKVSIGVLVDSISKTEMKDLKEPVMQVAEKEAYSKGNCINDREGHTSLVEKDVVVEQKDAYSWGSTKSFIRKISLSVAVQGTEHTPSFPAISGSHPRSKLLEITSAAHSPMCLASKTGLDSDECRQKYSGKKICSVETGKVNNGEHVNNLAFSTEPGVKDRTTETGGRETLRMKLWEILGNVSSPNKHCPSAKCEELHPDQEREGKQSLIEKIHLNSDTIESDSQTPVVSRPMTHLLTRRRTSSRKQSKKIEANESIHRKEYPQKRIFSVSEDCSRRLYNNPNDGSLPSKRTKTLRMSSRAQICQSHKYENAEERLQSEKRRSIPAVEKSLAQRGKASNASSSNHRRDDVLLEPEKGTKDNTFSDPPLNVATDLKDVQQPMNVEVSKKNQQEDLSISPFKNKRNSGHDPFDPPPENILLDCLPKSKQGKLQDRSPAENIFNTTGIQSFKSFFSSKSAECNPNAQLEQSDDRCEQIDSPNNSFLVKTSAPLDEDGENRMSKSATNEMNSEGSEDKSHMKGCGESDELFPEIFISENFLHSQNKSLDNDNELTGCSPASDSLKGNQDNDELDMYFEQNHEDGLARAVALFAVALNRLKTKLRSIGRKRFAEILRASVEEIFLRLQNAESLIKTDMVHLTSLIHLKGKQLEDRFQENQDQLLGIYKRFKEEVDQHLLDYGSLIEDLGEHEIDVKRSVEKQRVAHKKIIAQVEHEINAQLDGAESRIMAVQELAREKMLQLKLGVAGCLKHGALG